MVNQPTEPVPVTAPSPLDVSGSVALEGTPAVAVTNTPTVAVANSRSTPLFVFDVGSRALQPFQFEAHPVFQDAFATLSSELFTVPPEKLLVIQYV